jgi:Flp pilus assembly protein TadG
MLVTLSRPIRKHVGALARATSGVALIEFAYSLPLLVILGFGGFEVANYAVTNMRVAQIAATLADNASRFSEEVVGRQSRMREVDVEQAFYGAKSQAGNLDLKDNGRVILSSLELNEQNGQYIHWQRCWGDAPYTSSYGEEGDGEHGHSVTGMGPSDQFFKASENLPVMFVEVTYDYQPLALAQFIPKLPIRKVAGMYVRDDRDTSQLFPTAGITPSRCDP